jgi:hypothetical protein
MKIGRGNRSTRRKPAPAPLCPPQIPLDQTRARTRAAAVGSQRLTAWAMARPDTKLSGPQNQPKAVEKRRITSLCRESSSYSSVGQLVAHSLYGQSYTAKFTYIYCHFVTKSQSKIYFTTGGLPPISSSWRPASRVHYQSFFFFAT